MSEYIILKIVKHYLVKFDLIQNIIPIYVVEEAEEVECQLGPALPLALVQGGSVHDGGGVIQPWARHHRPVHVPTLIFIKLNNKIMKLYLNDIPKVKPRCGKLKNKKNIHSNVKWGWRFKNITTIFFQTLTS